MTEALGLMWDVTELVAPMVVMMKLVVTVTTISVLEMKANAAVAGTAAARKSSVRSL